MLKSKSFLAVDFGAGSLKLAEFEVNEAGGLRLKQYGLKSLGAEGAQESTREETILKALQELLAERGFRAREVNVCAPGFHVFSKFVKLPPVDAGKVTQIIQYEAQQNVPFPLAEVVWDYQILGSSPSGELEVLLVAINGKWGNLDVDQAIALTEAVQPRFVMPNHYDVMALNSENPQTFRTFLEMRESKAQCVIPELMQPFIWE